MKTKVFNYAWRDVRQISSSPQSCSFIAAVALLLTATNLFAGATVNWLSGGPNTGYPTGAGYSDGDITLYAEYHTPCGLAIDNTGNFLFVADRDNNAVRMLQFDQNNTYTLIHSNFFNKPVGVALAEADGTLYVLNRGNGTNGSVLKIGIDLADGIIGTISTNLTKITNAGGIAVDLSDNIYVTASNRVFKVAPSGVSNLVATVTAPGASLQGIVVKRKGPTAGLLAVCDSGRHGIYLIDPNTGVITTNAGFHGAGDFSSANNVASSNSAKFFQPSGVTEAGDGTLIISDYGNHRVKVVQLSGIVTNLYGVTNRDWVSPWKGFMDGKVVVPDKVGGVAARLPNGVVIAHDGSVYVTEDYYHIIRHVTGGGFPPPPPLPPAAPLNLTATATIGQVALSWSAATGATNYNVKRSPSSGGPYTIIGTTTGTSFTDSSVVGGTTYFYVVSGVNAGGEGPASNEVMVHAPLPPVPNPQIGYVDFPSTANPQYSSVFHPVSSFVLNNDALIVIVGEYGSQTFYTFGTTITNQSGVVTNPPDPTAASASAPPGYQDGLYYGDVIPYVIGQIMPDLTIKAIGEKSDGSPNSAIVQARFQFVTGNPVISGNNAALFTISDITYNADLLYTIDGSDPSPTNVNAIDMGTLDSVTNVWTVSLSIQSNTVFKARAFKAKYQPSAIVSNTFTTSAYQPTAITFGQPAGEPHSSFQARPGQFFYAPVTLALAPGFTKMYSLQFNVTVTNGLVNTNTGFRPPVVQPGLLGASIDFFPMLMTKVPPYEGQYYPPADGYWYLPIPAVTFNINGGNTNLYTNSAQIVPTIFVNTNNNLLGVGWLYRSGFTYGPVADSNGIVFLDFDTTKQDLISYSIAHDTLFKKANSLVVVGAYSFPVPTNASIGDKYFIQLGSPSATADGVGAPGGSIYIAPPFSNQAVTVTSPAYLVGDAAPFHWLNAGDFGDTNLDNSDVMQIYQASIPYPPVNMPPTNSDLFKAMDSSGRFGVWDSANGYYTNAGAFNSAQQQAMWDGNDLSINTNCFGDGVLDINDLYVTFRRSLDPSLVWFKCYWTNGQFVAVTATNYAFNTNIPYAAPEAAPMAAPNLDYSQSSINFNAGDAIVTANQAVQIPITAQILGDYPLRVLGLSITVVPLDGSPAITQPVIFSPNAGLGAPSISSARSAPEYSAAWLDSAISGLSGNTTLGTLTVTVPANATSQSAYAVHFGHVSGSPNGLAVFPKQTLTGLITLSSRSSSSYNDGIPDSWRLRWFGTIYNLLSVSNACPTGDGVSNWKKYIAGVDPNTANDFPSLNPKMPATPGATAAIHWPSVSGKQYVILRSSSLFPGTWSAIATNTGTGMDMEYDDTATGETRFYRVQILR